jgi:predicted Zn-dependent protease
MHNPMRIARVSVLLTFAALTSCQGFETVPESGRTRPKLQYTEAEMAKLGAEAYKEAIAEYKEITGTPEADLVNEVASKIAAATGKKYDWQFKLLDASDTVNAFCLPGGKIAVFSGILPIADGADGLAVVLGHEVAHATLQHGNERISQPRIKRILGRPIQFVTDTWGALAPRSRRAVMDGLGLGVIFGKAMPYSQDHETEADEIGLGYMRAAGYDVKEAPKFWRRMAVAAPSGKSDSLSTHPDPEKRAKRLEELIREGK